MEVRKAIMTGATRKAPGTDGIPFEFYRLGWDIIKTEMVKVFNDMFREEYITKEHGRRIIVCHRRQQSQRRSQNTQTERRL
jgi:hypothetical protein